MSDAATRTQLERRRERRIAVQLRVTIRGIDRSGVTFEEETKTENVCRGGIAFIIKHSVTPGMPLEVTIPNAVPARGKDPASDFDSKGRIIYVSRGSKGSLVGFQFTGPRFNRVFNPETAS